MTTHSCPSFPCPLCHIHARTTVGAAFVEPDAREHAQAVVQAQRADRAAVVRRDDGSPVPRLCETGGHLVRDGRCRWCGEDVAQTADALTALTDDIRLGLGVLNVRDHLALPDELLDERAANIAQALWGNFVIRLPDVEEQTPLPAILAKGG